MDTLIYFMFSFAVYIQISDSLYSCDQSIPTIAYVTSCPTNKTEWDIAARRKNCESLAAQQSCTSADNFQYHCLENQWQNMTLEICAPIFYLQGYCAKYNTDKKRVEENYANGFECLNFADSEKCPSRYQSTDAYKYQRCYKLKQQNPTQTACPICISLSQSGTTPIVTKEESGADDDGPVKTVFLVILVLALAGVIVSFILFCKRKSLNLKRFCKDAEKGPKDETKYEAEYEKHEHEDDVKSPLISKQTLKNQQVSIEVSSSTSRADNLLGKPNTNEENKKEEKEMNSQEKDLFKQNDGHTCTLKPMSQDDDATKLTLNELPASKPVTNDAPSDVLASASQTTSNSGFPSNNRSNKTTKKTPDLDDFKAKPTGDISNNGRDATSTKPVLQDSTATKSTATKPKADASNLTLSDENHTDTESTALKPITANNQLDENTTGSSDDPFKQSDDQTFTLKPMLQDDDASKLTLNASQPVSKGTPSDFLASASLTMSNSGVPFNRRSNKTTIKSPDLSDSKAKSTDDATSSCKMSNDGRDATSTKPVSQDSTATKSTATNPKADASNLPLLDENSTDTESDASKPITAKKQLEENTSEDPSKPNDGHTCTLKPMSQEDDASKLTLNNLPALQPVTNDPPSDVPASASQTTSNSGFSSNNRSNKTTIKSPDLDDFKAKPNATGKMSNNGRDATSTKPISKDSAATKSTATKPKADAFNSTISDKTHAETESTASKPITGKKQLDENTTGPSAKPGDVAAPNDDTTCTSKPSSSKSNEKTSGKKKKAPVPPTPCNSTTDEMSSTRKPFLHSEKKGKPPPRPTDPPSKP